MLSHYSQLQVLLGTNQTSKMVYYLTMSKMTVKRLISRSIHQRLKVISCKELRLQTPTTIGKVN